MPEKTAEIDKIRRLYSECFGCGLDNPMGLHLDGFIVDGGEVKASFTPRDEYSGFAGVLHGGIVATLLDETLAWSAMLLEGIFVVTASLELKYRKPAPAQATYQVSGRVASRRGRRLRLEGEALVDGTVIAQAAGLFMATNPIDQ